jgi:hypothetical protein
MRVVRNIKTKRLIWREVPEFRPGLGIANAVKAELGAKEDLEEVEVTEKEWAAEMTLQQADKPKTEMQILKEQMAALETRLKAIEPKS